MKKLGRKKSLNSNTGKWGLSLVDHQVSYNCKN